VELANGDGTYTLRSSYLPQFVAAVQTSGSKVLVGSFNGTGRPSLAVLGADRSLSLALSNVDGTFKQVTSVLDAGFGYWASLPGVQLVAADFRGSGFMDLAVFGGPCPGFYVELANGDGTYTLRSSYLPQFVAAVQGVGSRFLVADYNGDGLQDIAVFGTSFALAISKRDGTFSQVSQPFFGSPKLDASIFAGIFY